MGEQRAGGQIWRVGRVCALALCGALIPSGIDATAAAGDPGDTVEVVRGAQKQQVRPGEASQLAEQREFPRVEVFLTDWCPYCRKLEAFLKQNGVPYERKNIEQDARFEREHEALGGGGIPLIRIGGERVVRGFMPEVIARELGLDAPK